MEIKFIIPKEHESEFISIWESEAKLKADIKEYLVEVIKQYRYAELESQIIVKSDIIN